MLGRVLYGFLAILATALAGSPALFGAFSLAKGLLVLSLFYGWGRHLPKVFWVGMFFAWVGDVSLLWPQKEGFFMAGMGSFAMMWGLYGVGWWRLNADVRGLWYGVLAGVAVGLGAGIVWYLWPLLEAPFSFLVPGYAVFLVGASLGALRLRSGLLWLGLLSFWVSDALIAYMKFVRPIWYGDKWVMGLYALGHGLIVAHTHKVVLRGERGGPKVGELHW
jgi:hypothetical protein